MVSQSLVVAMDTETTEELVQEFHAREVCNRVQQLRKTAGLVPTQEVSLFVSCEDEKLNATIKEKREYIEGKLRRPLGFAADIKEGAKEIARAEEEIEGVKLTVIITE